MEYQNLKFNINEVNELNTRLQQKLDAEIMSKANDFTSQTMSALNRDDRRESRERRDSAHSNGRQIRLENQRFGDSLLETRHNGGDKLSGTYGPDPMNASRTQRGPFDDGIAPRRTVPYSSNR